jgi:hypothetical protein
MMGGTHLSARVRSVIRSRPCCATTQDSGTKAWRAAAARRLARGAKPTARGAGGDERMSGSGGARAVERRGDFVTPPAESLGLPQLAAEGFAAERRGA